MSENRGHRPDTPKQTQLRCIAPPCTLSKWATICWKSEQLPSEIVTSKYYKKMSKPCIIRWVSITGTVPIPTTATCPSRVSTPTNELTDDGIIILLWYLFWCWRRKTSKRWFRIGRRRRRCAQRPPAPRRRRRPRRPRTGEVAGSRRRSLGTGASRPRRTRPLRWRSGTWGTACTRWPGTSTWPPPRAVRSGTGTPCRRYMLRRRKRRR